MNNNIPTASEHPRFKYDILCNIPKMTLRWGHIYVKFTCVFQSLSMNFAV